jgi:hypothetical protein
VEQTLGQEDPGIDSYRALRDEILAHSITGQYYIALYEEHGSEAVLILARDPQLVTQAAELLRQWQPVVESLVAMQQGDVETEAAQHTVAAQDVAEVQVVLGSLMERGSPALRADLSPVLARLDDFVDRTPVEILEMLNGEDAQYRFYLPLVLSSVKELEEAQREKPAGDGVVPSKARPFLSGMSLLLAPLLLVLTVLEQREKWRR